MTIFKDIEDLEDWLEPMSYEEFWSEIGPYALVLQPRDHCDQQIASGEADPETVLIVLKNLARIELSRVLRLERRDTVPEISLH